VLGVYRKVALLTGQRAFRAWPVALSLFVYGAIIVAAALLVSPLGMIGGFLMSFVVAACLSSYLELISQAVVGSKIHLRWADLKHSFGARLWDVVSVMFAFWIIGMVTGPALMSPNGQAVGAILAIAMGFFFNAVPELLYQGSSRSFALLLDSGRFMLAHPVIWLLPSLLFAAVALFLSGQLFVGEPALLLVTFGQIFSSPGRAVMLLLSFPRWAIPIVVVAFHYLMVFRGILFAELSSGSGNARLRAFQAQMRR
jgi:hypothetical protein